MSENPLHDELRALAEQVAHCEDPDVADSGEVIAKLYRQERAVIHGLLNVDAMVRGDEAPPDEYDPRLVAVRERMRERLKGLLAWARQTKRI